MALEKTTSSKSKLKGSITSNRSQKNNLNIGFTISNKVKQYYFLETL